MSDEPMVTEREAVKRERRAVVMAIEEAWPQLKNNQLSSGWEGTRALSMRLFPLPKITKPREVTDKSDDISWRIVDGWFEFRANTYTREWRPARRFDTPYVLTVERVTFLATLVADPTEEVPDET